MRLWAFRIFRAGPHAPPDDSSGPRVRAPGAAWAWISRLLSSRSLYGDVAKEQFLLAASLLR